MCDPEKRSTLRLVGCGLRLVSVFLKVPSGGVTVEWVGALKFAKYHTYY